MSLSLNASLKAQNFTSLSSDLKARDLLTYSTSQAKLIMNEQLKREPSLNN